MSCCDGRPKRGNDGGRYQLSLHGYPPLRHCALTDRSQTTQCGVNADECDH
jgi:hypothetical protein